MKFKPHSGRLPKDSSTTRPQSETLPPLFGDPRKLAAASGVLAVATFLMFGDLLFAGGDRVLSMPHGDLFTQFVGWSDFTFGQMAGGNLPLWNPHLYSGAPCLGGFQEALLYPPAWLHLFLPLPQAFNWGIALHVFFAGAFTYMWMARRGVHPAAATVSGLVFMFGGGYFMHILPGHIPNLRTMAWAPLIFLAIDDLTTTRSLRGAWVGAGAVAMSVLAGHVQYVYYTAIASLIYAILSLWKSPWRRRAIAGLLLMVIGGAALSAAQLLTGLQATSESARSALTYDTASLFPFPPENLLTLALPNVFGSITPEHSTYWGRWFIWEDSLFIGAAACTLVVIGAVRGLPEHRRFALPMVIVSLVLALGCYTPLYVPLFKWLPGFASFRGVCKFAFLAALFLASLAGAGFDRLLCAGPMPRCPVKTIGGLALLIFVLGLFIFFSGQEGIHGSWGRFLASITRDSGGYRFGSHFNPVADSNTVRDTAKAAASDSFVAAVVLALVIGFWFKAVRRRGWIMGIGGLVALELLLNGWQNRPTFALADTLDIALGLHELEGITKPGQRVITHQPALMMMAGGDDAWGNDPMVLKRYLEFLAYGQGTPPEQMLASPYPFFTGVGRNWGLLRIGAVMVPTSDGTLQPATIRAPLLDRAQLIDRAQVIQGPEQLLETLGSGHFPYTNQVLLEQPVTPMPTGDNGQAGPAGTVDLKDLSTDAMEFTVQNARSVILLVTDNYASGWRARSLDPNPQNYQVVRADYTLRGIPLAPGKHHFILEYVPTAYVIGKWVTLSSLLVYLVLALRLWALPAFAKRRAASRSPLRHSE